MIRKRLASLVRRIKWSCEYLKGPRAQFVDFRCNICGKKTSFPQKKLSRELWSCFHCGSNVRWRSVIHALSCELFGSSLALPDFPRRPDIAGLGLSDWEGYAAPLAKKVAYTNTFYHQDPLFDITSVDPSRFGRYDFIISSDVFEHICPPISKAFENGRRLLKPNGVMIFTVPYIEGETREHFPELHRYSIEQRGDRWVVVNQTADGRHQEFFDVTFHGGPGTVLEMRLFGKQSILRDAQEAGFEYVKLYDEEYQKFGIAWPAYIPENAPYHPLIYGLDTPPWALGNRSSDAK